MNYNSLMNSIGFSIDDSNNNIASGTNNCWANKYVYFPLNFSPLFGNRIQREGFIFVCPMTDPATICVSINKSQKQITVKGKRPENKYLVLSNFPYTDLDFCIDADKTKRFDRNSISYKFDNGILTVEFSQVEDNQFELVRNQPIFNNRPVERVVEPSFKYNFGLSSTDKKSLSDAWNKFKTSHLPTCEVYPKSVSTPNLQSLNLPSTPSVPLPPIPPAPLWLKKNDNKEGDITPEAPEEVCHYQTPEESSNDDIHTTSEDGITLLKKQNFNGEWRQNDSLYNETPTVGDE